MSSFTLETPDFTDIRNTGRTAAVPVRLARLRYYLEIDTSSHDGFAGSMPFSAGDITAGAEDELQTAVEGLPQHVDLAATLRNSNFYRNLVRRAASGDASTRSRAWIDDFLEHNSSHIWENSWVHFPRSRLSQAAQACFDHDLRSDKRVPGSPLRSDAAQFTCPWRGEAGIRIPVSYLLKIALSDALATGTPPPPVLQRIGEPLMQHFLNDNTSPETTTFHPVLLDTANGLGRPLAEETLRRFLLTQALVAYANVRFGLKDSGQTVHVYFAPHTPGRQMALNDHISDTLYRDLFISPCLSGWDRGQDKRHYMVLCHEVLSRSRLNAIAKLKESQILTSRLAVFTGVSNTCLSNNGTHVSLGSRRLSRARANGEPGFSAAEEKWLGDLGIKIVEHFLPLLVGTYSADPYRFGYADFHAETVLGFLPHELDYTHLRMIWRRWKNKARIKRFGHRFTPCGLDLLDRWVGHGLALQGDLIPDFRLIDYLTSPLSSDENPALDGTCDNDLRLKQDLMEMGVFDTRMSLYQLYKLRLYDRSGFTGFEGRTHSLFPSILDDMAPAVGIQSLLTAMAMKYALLGTVGHGDIPDEPSVESERRQLFFAAAIGLPTVYVRHDTRNQFMQRILKQVSNRRMSHRYAGYIRMPLLEYRKGLLRLIRADAPELVEQFRLHPVLDELEQRLDASNPRSATGRLLQAMTGHADPGRALNMKAETFNRLTETFYRTSVRRSHLSEAMDVLEQDAIRLRRQANPVLGMLFGSVDPERFVQTLRTPFLDHQADEASLRNLIRFLLIAITSQARTPP